MARIYNSPPRTTAPAYLVLIVASTAAFGLLIAGCGRAAKSGPGGGSGFSEYPSCNDICNPACAVYSPGACGVVVGGGTGTGTGTGTSTGTSVGSCSDACDAGCAGYDAGACDGGGIGDGGCDIDSCGSGDGGTTVDDPGDGGGDPGVGDGGDGGGDTGVGDGGGDYGGGDPGDGGGGDGGGGDGGGDDGGDGEIAHPGNGAHPAIVRRTGNHLSSLQLRDTLPGFSPRDLAKARHAVSTADPQKPGLHKEEQ